MVSSGRISQSYLKGFMGDGLGWRSVLAGASGRGLPAAVFNRRQAGFAKTERMWRSALDGVDGETPGVSLKIAGGIKRGAVEEFFWSVIYRPVVHADFGHRLGVEVVTADLIHDGIIRCAFRHAPAAELGEPPLAVFRLREIAVPFAEMHVVVVLLFPSVTVVVVAQQAAENDFLRAVDVGRLRDDVALLGTVVQVVEPNAGVVQTLEHGFHGLRVFLGELGGEGADFFR